MNIDTIEISVVTVCYNVENTIEQTILSVIGQTYPNIQYIIIDGNSTDGTMDIVMKYKEHIDIIVSEPDNGIYDAMNKSLQYVKGDFLNFMNAGDMFCSDDVVSKVFNREYDSSVGFIFGTLLTKRGHEEKHLPFMRNPAKYKKMGISHQSIFVRSELAKRIKFRYDLPVAADYGMIYAIWKEGYQYVEHDFPICIFEGGGFSVRKPWLLTHDIAVITGSTNTVKYRRKMFTYWARYYIQAIGKIFHVTLCHRDYSDMSNS